VDAAFGLAGLVPTGPRPSRADVFGSIDVDYKLFLNVLGTAVFVVLFWLGRGGGSAAHCERHEGDGTGEREAAGV
jgi:hypothetical protein